MAEKDVEEFLAHFGVLGMKWGKRKADSAPRRGPAHEDYTSSRAALRTQTRELSTRQIQATNSRLQQERTLADLKRQNTVLAKGQNHLKVLIGLGALSVSIATLAATPLGKGAIGVGKRAFEESLKGKGRHVFGAVIPVAKAAARHL